MGFLAASLAASACSGPSAPVPTGFEPACGTAPRIGGRAEMGVSNDGFVSGIEDLTISVRGGAGAGGCFGGTLGDDE